MTPSQYRDAIDRLGLSQRAAADFLGVEERTCRRWLKGTNPPHCIGLLLGLMLELGLTVADVEAGNSAALMRRIRSIKR